MDYNKIAAIEHEMEKKFGPEAVKHPRADWTIEDEKEYITQTSDLHDKLSKLQSEKTYINKKGYLISKKLLNEDVNKIENCEFCNKYRLLFTVDDDINLNKYGCCRDCYYNFVDGREERWHEGWRPEKITK